ncbi:MULTISPECIES: LysR family transcriptional regulator [Xanthomonas]|uniref:LysR family transcriptional regulator n=1 Tax=Xanthomonas euroxanthea TaxID=2259622 RepID=A0AA46C8Q6_9XANT|nr:MULTISPECIES: LysR family transcriptional regulator [Xanthomonas]NJB77642.1 DNA-binding transcriptional LysR family regulator [Xanthomonas arboricola]CAE1136349.1 LysR family transcriptional regulator [Xanthomonas euroxanthea]SUZ28383.1 LysR family transcriptional regulator [Xanthomonas euroxanthea]
MRREDISDLSALLVIADEGSFTKASAKIGISQSALSHTVRRLEARLGIRLLNRTTRAVTPTEACERLMEKVRPLMSSIDSTLESLEDLRLTPGGAIRITSSEHAAKTIIWPKLKVLSREHPQLKVELSVDGALRDIVAERFDAGVRLGESVAPGMVSIKIGPPYTMAVVASRAYLRRHGTPRVPKDLAAHNCINIRFPTMGNLFAWDLEKDGKELSLRVDGQLVLNNRDFIVDAAVSGLGIAYLLDDQVRPQLEDGTLVRLLKDWCPPFPGHHLYYSSQRQLSPGMKLLIDALRHD